MEMLGFRYHHMARGLVRAVVVLGWEGRDGLI